MNNIHIDETKLLELKSLLEESFSMLVVTFIQDTEEQLTKLENCIAQKKYLELSKISHGMKGSSANMGAIYLNSLVVSLESSCKKEDYLATLNTINLIRQHYPVMKTIFENLIL